MSPNAEPIVQMASITKTFPGPIAANDDVSLAVFKGEIHALIGENGAGKSTLAGVLYGKYQPDSGRIRIRGNDVRISGPAKAISLGIGMVTQHTTLIPALSALDNVILGAEPGTAGVISRREALARVGSLSSQLGIELNWNAEAESFSIAALQKAEIVKTLYRGAEILILDEPTATLAPRESEALFKLLRSLVSGGCTVIFVTHKLREVMEYSNRITVLRGGKLAGERLTSETYPEDLLALMLGQRTASPGVRLDRAPLEELMPKAPWERGPHSELLGQFAGSEQAPHASAPPVPTLEVKSLYALNNRRGVAVHDLTLNVLPGEVLGVAGVDGSGQKELAEAIIGLRPVSKGGIWLDGNEVTALSIAARMKKGLSFIPEDRQREGLILDFSIADNFLLGRQRDPEFGGGRTLDLATVEANGEGAVRQYRIRAGGGDILVKALSGGNQQKVVIARALSGEPRLLVAMQPTRGLDVEATRFVYESIRAAVINGLAVLLFSLDLDEIFEMSDRIAVMYNGGLADILPRREATNDSIGRLMLEGKA